MNTLENQKQLLCLQYPILKKYIIQCFEENRLEELWSFLDGIKLSDTEVSE